MVRIAVKPSRNIHFGKQIGGTSHCGHSEQLK
jgi:hypothetical protein